MYSVGIVVQGKVEKLPRKIQMVTSITSLGVAKAILRVALQNEAERVLRGRTYFAGSAEQQDACRSKREASL